MATSTTTTTTTTITWRFRCCEGWCSERHTGAGATVSPPVRLIRSVHGQPSLADAQIPISRAFGNKKGLQAAQLLFIDVLAQTVGVGRLEDAVVAVDGGQHAREQGGAGMPRRDQCAVLLQPAVPTPLRRCGRLRTLGEYQRFKPAQALSQGAHTALTHQPVIGKHDAAQKIDALCAALYHGFAGVQLQCQPVLQKLADAGVPVHQGGGVVGQQHKVVDVAQVAPDFEGVFDKLVKLIEVDVGKELAGEAANGHAHPRRCGKQRFVWRNARQQSGVAAAHGRRVNGRLAHDGGGHLVEHAACNGWVGQSGQRLLPQSPQHGAVYAREKGPDVHVAVPTVPGLSHEVLQAINGGQGALAQAIGVAVVDEASVPPGLNVLHQPLLDQAVGKVWGKDFAQFGVCDGKNRQGFGVVLSADDVARQLVRECGQAEEVRAFVFAVARPCRTLQQLGGNGVDVHGGR